MNTSPFIRLCVITALLVAMSGLASAQDAAADLLLKGAYARNRLRQLVFGGATRQILLASPIPVLIAR